MKKLILIIFVMLVSMYCQCEVLDRIIAKVGDDIILNSDLEKQITQMKQADLLNEDYDKMTVLKQMVQFKIMVQKAKQLGYEVPKSKIDEKAQQRLQQISARFNSENEFNKELKKSGMNKYDLLDYFKKIIEEQYLNEKVLASEIESKIEINEEDIEEYYNLHKFEFPLRKPSYKLAMIINQIKPSKKTKKIRYEQLEEIYDRISRGEDFAELAEEYSDCGSKISGGDLGFFSRGTMVKSFEDVAFKLKPGEISDIIETQFGYHIIKLEDVRDKEIHCRHILKALTPTQKDSLATKKFTEDLRDKYLNGTPFSEIAKFSDDQESALNGGVIGIFPHGEYPPLYEKYFKVLSPGQISQVILVEDMYCLFANLEDIPEGIFSLEEIYDKVKELTFNDLKAKMFEKWVEKAKNDIYVEITY